MWQLDGTPGLINVVTTASVGLGRWMIGGLLLLIVPLWAKAQPEQLMKKANDLYAEKQYGQAIQNYEQLLSEGYTSEVLHYNLGNAYYRNQQLGLAILHYEKARQIDPSDEDILHNLEVAHSAQLDQIEDLPAFFLTQWWKHVRALLSTGGWTVLGLILLWGSAAGFLLWLLGKQRKQRKRGFWWGWSLLIACLLPFALAVSRHQYDQHSREAILLSQETQLHYAPDADSEVVLTIHEGLKVDLQDRISDWYKVRLPNGEVGWLPVETVEEI
ncbi:MAG: tetratricopeptide repeat protein [Saprospiraceae bacterium]|nr:tetratricopeptide repeat protein [Lewinella sp.]